MAGSFGDLRAHRTLCRLRLLQLNGGRMVGQNPLPESSRGGSDLSMLTSMLNLPMPGAKATKDGGSHPADSVFGWETR